MININIHIEIYAKDNVTPLRHDQIGIKRLTEVHNRRILSP